MKTIENVYNKQILDFMNKKLTKKKDVILFFQGFSSVFYKTLDESKIKHFSGISFNKYIDYNKIDTSILLQKFISSKGLCWGFYEELIGLTEILNDLTIYKGEIIVVKNNLFSVYYPLEIPIKVNEVSKIYEKEFSNIDNKRIARYYSDFKIIDSILFFSYINKHYDIDTNAKICEIDFFQADINIDQYIKNDFEEEINAYDLLKIKTNLLEGKVKPNHYAVKCLNDELSREISILNKLGNSIGVFFRAHKILREVNDEDSNRYLQLFRKYWGNVAHFYDKPFYKDPTLNNETINISQGLLITDVIRQCEIATKGNSNNYSDIIITAPTGAGKSLIFQVPAIHLHEKYKLLTIVICPLVSLMYDQVKEIQERGIGFATYINSEISYEERQDRLEGIIEGRYSIIYLSPELLLSYNIKDLVGDRKIGLMVIDEAHLVTSWGRDFRVDYWFLGDHIEKIRRGTYYKKHNDAMNFPVICLTATAVFGGRDDVIGDLQNNLHLNCSSEHLYIGYVKRNNISFKINVPKTKLCNSKKEEKLLLSKNRIESFIKNKEKSIVYFPYVSQIEDVYNSIIDNYPELIKYIERYSGSGMRKIEKNESYNTFRESKVSVMLATKAFGMGINIPDVTNIYHYAPTGTLADYVQEIGRAARKIKQGYAITDYLSNDMRYAKTLWGLSGLRHYQIKALMKKLYDLYKTKKSRNLLFSPDAFSYLFDANSVNMKVKSGLMLLSSDLLEKYHFRVINVRPKYIFSKNYINVPNDIEKEFLSEFGGYCELMNDDKPLTTLSYGYNQEVTTYNTGKIYEINLGKVWETEFNELTFARFKYHFFIGDLFTFGTSKISPRIKLVINYNKTYDVAMKGLLQIISGVQKTFNRIYKRYGGKTFTFKEFSKIFNENYDGKIRREYLIMLLDIFCYNKTDIYNILVEQWKFIERRKINKDKQFGEINYCIRTRKHVFIEKNIRRYLKQAKPNSKENKTFIAYLAIPKNNQKYSEYQLVAALLEMFNLATYDLTGGRNLQIFVRINDPLKLKRIVESRKEYRNRLLTDIEERHKRSAIILDRFMNTKLSDIERWSIIENYFLGFDGEVDRQLGINRLG